MTAGLDADTYAACRKIVDSVKTRFLSNSDGNHDTQDQWALQPDHD